MDWEARMSERAWTRARQQRFIEATGKSVEETYGVFAPWVKPSDPVGILPEIIAARCLGITYGDPGPRLPADLCRECYGDRHVWLGNCWGVQHTGVHGSLDCPHSCHEGEVWLASA